MPYYIEKDGKPVLIDDVLEWARWFEMTNRTIRLTKIVNNTNGGILAVSTVFIGTSIGSEQYPSYCYETAYILYFGTNEERIYVFKRSSSREEALEDHQNYINTYTGLMGDRVKISEDITNVPVKTVSDINPLDQFEIID